VFEIKLQNKKGDWERSARCGAASCEVGRSRDSIIRVRGWRVAPRHARIEQEISGLFVEDVSRGYGLTVNGENQERYGPIQPEDEIEFGGYIFHVRIINNVDVELSETKEGTETESVNIAECSQSTQPDDQLAAASNPRDAYMKWAKYIHKELLRQMDLRRTQFDDMSYDQVRTQLMEVVDNIIQSMTTTLPASIEHDVLMKIVLDEAVGLGALEDLLSDRSVTEIMVNRYDDIYVERDGVLSKTDVTFTSDDAVMSTIERIISPLGRRIDESSPMVDARLADGSRVNAIIPPLALNGPCITIRKFSEKKLDDRDLIRFGAVDESMVKFIRTCVEQRKNMVISGGTGSGKTTLLNILSNYIPFSERVITVEDAAELRLVQPHVISLEARPPNMEGRGQVTIRDLVKNCLRMRPDRIVVGECRGGEALDMLQAMNTGHDGSLTTAHANNPRDMLRRLEVMVLMAGMELPVIAIREQIASAVDVIIQQTRFGDGSRRITSITEITGIEGSTIQLNEIFRFRQQGFDSDGRIKGEFEATGQVPQFYEDLQARGIEVDMSIFRQ